MVKIPRFPLMVFFCLLLIQDISASDDLTLERPIDRYMIDIHTRPRRQLEKSPTLVFNLKEAANQRLPFVDLYKTDRKTNSSSVEPLVYIDFYNGLVGKVELFCSSDFNVIDQRLIKQGGSTATSKPPHVASIEYCFGDLLNKGKSIRFCRIKNIQTDAGIEDNQYEKFALKELIKTSFYMSAAQFIIIQVGNEKAFQQQYCLDIKFKNLAEKLSLDGGKTRIKSPIFPETSRNFVFSRYDWENPSL